MPVDVSRYNSLVQPNIPDKILQYAEMSYGAAHAKAEEEYKYKTADLRAGLGAKGLA